MKTDGVDWIEPNEVLTLEFPDEGLVKTSKQGFFLNDPRIPEQWGFIPLDVDALHRNLGNSAAALLLSGRHNPASTFNSGELIIVH